MTTANCVTSIRTRTVICSGLVLFVLALTVAGALACDDVCHPGEMYSDQAEMCVPDTRTTS